MPNKPGLAAPEQAQGSGVGSQGRLGWLEVPEQPGDSLSLCQDKSSAPLFTLLI